MLILEVGGKNSGGVKSCLYGVALVYYGVTVSAGAVYTIQQRPCGTRLALGVAQAPRARCSLRLRSHSGRDLPSKTVGTRRNVATQAADQLATELVPARGREWKGDPAPVNMPVWSDSVPRALLCSATAAYRQVTCLSGTVDEQQRMEFEEQRLAGEQSPRSGKSVCPEHFRFQDTGDGAGTNVVQGRFNSGRNKHEQESGKVGQKRRKCGRHFRRFRAERDCFRVSVLLPGLFSRGIGVKVPRRKRGYTLHYGVYPDENKREVKSQSGDSGVRVRITENPMSRTGSGMD